MDTGGDDSIMDDQILEFESAPDSELMHSAKMGRPRDTTYDGIVREAYDSRVAKRVSVFEADVRSLITGIKRSAKHVGVSVSFLTFPPVDEQVTVEFIAYPTHSRKG
jgi:hypothetical protein